MYILIVSFTAEFGGAQIVNDYIQSGTRNLREAIWALDFWTWSTEEVADMLEWMKKYNENPTNETKIKFYGFDMQNAQNDIEYVMQYLSKFDGDISLSFVKLVSDFGTKYKRFNNNPSNHILSDLLTDIDKIKNIFEENKDNYILKSSKAEYELIFQHLNILTQYFDFNEHVLNNDFTKSFNTRDYHMAQNAKWIMDYETENFGNEKIMLWAHNGHVSKKYGDFISMGENLSTIFNDEYYAIGFDFYQGSFRAYGANVWGERVINDLSNFTIQPSPKRTFAYQFEKTGVPLSYLDFKSVVEDKDLLNFLSEERLVHNIGAIYMGKYFSSKYLLKIIPIETYDAVIFIKETSAAVGINKYITKIEDGDQILADYYRPVVMGGIVALIVIVFAIIFITRFILKKIKSRKGQDG